MWIIIELCLIALPFMLFDGVLPSYKCWNCKDKGYIKGEGYELQDMYEPCPECQNQ